MAATVVDDPQGKVDILTAQFADVQPEGDHAAVAVDAAPYGRMLSGIRGIRLSVQRVDARFKYDDHNPVEHRERVINNGRNAAVNSIPEPQPSNSGGWPQSATGEPANGHEPRPGHWPCAPWVLSVVAMLSVQLASALWST